MRNKLSYKHGKNYSVHQFNKLRGIIENKGNNCLSQS